MRRRRCRSRPATPEGSDCWAPGMTGIDRRKDRVDAHGEAVGGGRARHRAQDDWCQAAGLGSPREAARRSGHDGGPGSKVARVADGDAVFGGRAGDPGEFDGVATAGSGATRSSPLLEVLDDVRGGAEVRTDGDAGCSDWTGNRSSAVSRSGSRLVVRQSQMSRCVSDVAPPPVCDSYGSAGCRCRARTLSERVHRRLVKRRSMLLRFAVPMIAGHCQSHLQLRRT